MIPYEKIRILCLRKSEYISNLPVMIPELKCNSSAISHWKKGFLPSNKNGKLIADYFDITIESLYKNDNYVVKNNGTVIDLLEEIKKEDTIDKQPKTKLSELETQLLDMFSKLEFMDKLDVIQYVHKKVNE